MIPTHYTPTSLIAFTMPEALSKQKSRYFSPKGTSVSTKRTYFFIKGTGRLSKCTRVLPKGTCFCTKSTFRSAKVSTDRKKVLVFCQKVTVNLQKVLAGRREAGTFFSEFPARLSYLKFFYMYKRGYMPTRDAEFILRARNIDTQVTANSVDWELSDGVAPMPCACYPAGTAGSLRGGGIAP